MSKAVGISPVAYLAEQLKLKGIPLHELVAEGVIAKLHSWCWANQTDLLGKAEDIDRIAGFVLGPLAMASVLHKSRILCVEQGVYFMPSAYRHRPYYVDTAWKRRDRPSMKMAMRRSAKNKIKQVLYVPDHETEFAETGTVDLFGEHEVEVIQTEEVKSGTPGYNELRDHFCEQWKRTEGGGQKEYPFRHVGYDREFIIQILEGCGTLEDSKLAVDGFIRDTRRFYSGHVLKRLVHDLPRFIAAGRHSSNRQNYNPHALEYGGADDGLPDLRARTTGS